jgi:nucleoside-diphosphate kinase
MTVDAIIKPMQKHHKYEQTLVVLKPDAVQRSLIGEIINRFEKVGLKMVGIKMFVPDEEFVRIHCTLDPSWMRKVGEKNIKNYHEKGRTPPSDNPLEVGEIVLNTLKSYLTSGPVVAMVWQGAHAVDVVRKLVGSTEPRSSDVGTIRGDFVLDSYEMSDADNRAIRNLIHASGNVEEANMEIPHWFSTDEIAEYKLVQEGILYGNMEGIFE